MASHRKGAGDGREHQRTGWKVIFDRKTFWGSFAFNLIAALLPALYSTLSKLWVARIDQSHLATTSLYDYLGKISSILNDTLPRVVWLVIGDGTTRTLDSRLELAYTLIGIQALLGLILTLVFIGAAPFFAKAFTSADIWITSVRYVQIAAPVALCILVKGATGASARALDQPDVSVMITIFSSLANLILDFLLISNFHVPGVTPSIHLQAGIQLVCNFLGALVGLVWFAWNNRRLRQKNEVTRVRVFPTWKALRVLIRPASWMFLESLTRNVIYLWVVSRIATLGNAYITAFGVFEGPIRWGLIMVPASALYNSGSTFVGHNWGKWRGESGASQSFPILEKGKIKAIITPALHCIVVALTVEIIFCIGLSISGIWEFAYFISNSTEVADIVRDFWRNVEWCYVIFAIGWQAGSILLATSPKLFLYASLSSNVAWMLPWAAVLTTTQLHGADVWRLVTICLGGAQVVDSLSIGVFLLGWYWALRRGKMYVTPVSAELRPSPMDRSLELT